MNEHTPNPLEQAVRDLHAALTDARRDDDPAVLVTAVDLERVLRRLDSLERDPLRPAAGVVAMPILDDSSRITTTPVAPAGLSDATRDKIIGTLSEYDQPDRCRNVLENTWPCVLEDHIARGWTNLHRNILDARDGVWSVGAESELIMLVRGLRAGGDASIDRVDYGAIHSGLYRTVLEIARIKCPNHPEYVAHIEANAARYMADQQVRG